MFRKIKYALCVLLSSLLLFFIMVRISPFRIISYSTQAAGVFGDDHKKKLEKVYDVKFTIEKSTPGSMTTFLPSLSHTDYDEAQGIAEMFISVNERAENDEYFYFKNLNENVCVYKFGNRIVYESKVNNGNNPRDYSKEAVISETQAADICAQFIMSKFDNFIYEEVEIVFDGSLFEITFINRLANLMNFAFNTQVVLSSAGEIIRLDYFSVDYLRLNGTKIKSMEEAYYELPIDFIGLEQKYKVDLQKCALVYHYQDSVVQPAYMFEGEAEFNKSFKCFVNASLYDY